jgi:hypothetical protein
MRENERRSRVCIHSTKASAGHMENAKGPRHCILRHCIAIIGAVLGTTVREPA